MFVESEVYDARTALGGNRFDLVYTGTGALTGPPDVRRGRRWWPSCSDGRSPYIREEHPVLWSLDTSARTR